VKSPIRGQLSRFYFTEGNLISQDQTLLTTVVAVDQVYAYFDMDERTLQRINGQVIAGRIKPPAEGAKVVMGLGSEVDFPYQGRIDFLNNVVNPSTGTISVRGVFDNPKSAGGTRMLAPGMFVRIRLPIGEPRRSALVVDRAIGSDQGLKYVYVVDGESKIRYRRVATGPLQDDGLRVIEPYRRDEKTKAESGLRPDEWVVVGSLPQLRPGMDVQQEQIPMPVPGGPVAGVDVPPPAGKDNAPKAPRPDAPDEK
jgi:RND family efflux transporter MFP subunit